MSGDIDGIIGRLDWNACDACVHYDNSQGCEYEGAFYGGVPLSIDGDFVDCDMFERKVLEEADDE